MKKILTSLVGLAFSAAVSAQEIKVAEPEFINQVVIVQSDSTGVLLGKENGEIKTKAGASLYLTGIGSIKSRITLNGKYSETRIPKNAKLTLIVKAVDNRTDPASIIRVFKFEVKSNRRQVEIGKVNTFEGGSNNTMKLIQFQAKKYGESSYLIVLENLSDGEYGVMTSNPNAVDSSNGLMVNTFGIGEKGVEEEADDEYYHNLNRGGNNS